MKDSPVADAAGSTEGSQDTLCHADWPVVLHILILTPYEDSEAQSVKQLTTEKLSNGESLWVSSSEDLISQKPLEI